MNRVKRSQPHSVIRPMWKRVLECEGGWKAWLGYVAVGALAAGSIGSSQYSASASRTLAKKQEGARVAEAARIEKENKAALAKAEAEKATAERQAKQQITMRNRARARSRTVFTSPLGAPQDQTSIQKKTLLGQ